MRGSIASRNDEETGVRCPRCKYDVSGVPANASPDGRCPECGLEDPTRRSFRRLVMRYRRLIHWGAPLAAIVLIGGPWAYIRTHPDWRTKIPTPVLAGAALMFDWGPPRNDTPYPSLQTELASRIYRHGAEWWPTSQVFERWIQTSIELYEGPSRLHLRALNIAWIQSGDTRTVRIIGASYPSTLIARGRWGDNSHSDWTEIGAYSTVVPFWSDPIGTIPLRHEEPPTSIELRIVSDRKWGSYQYPSNPTTVEEVLASTTHAHEFEISDQVRPYRSFEAVESDVLQSLIRDSIRFVDHSKVGTVCLEFRASDQLSPDLSVGFRATLCDDGWEIGELTMWNDDGVQWHGGAIVTSFSWPGAFFSDLQRDMSGRFTLRIEGEESIASRHPTATRYWSGSFERPVNEILIDGFWGGTTRGDKKRR